MLCNNGYGKRRGNGNEYGYVDGNGNGDGYGYGYSGEGYGYGYGSGDGKGDPHPTNKLSAMAVPEDPACTRLLTNRYPDINFYICQLQLLKGRSP